MGNRFGRNQKRRYQELLAAAEGETVLAEGRVAEYQRSLGWSRDRYNEMTSELSQVFATIQEVCGTNTGLLPPKTVKDWGTVTSYRIRSIEHCFRAYRPGLIPKACTETSIDCHALRIYLEERKDCFQNYMHLLYVGDDTHITYLMTQQMFDNMPKKQLETEIARQITREMTEYLRRKP